PLLSTRPVHSVILPYTTLFRSLPMTACLWRPKTMFRHTLHLVFGRSSRTVNTATSGCTKVNSNCLKKPTPPVPTHRSFKRRPSRSEEHTSELQSRQNLVFRLLL